MTISRYHISVNTPLGVWTLVASPRGLQHMLFENEPIFDDSISMIDCPSDHHPAQKHLLQAQQELQEYFQGQRQKLEVPLDLSGTSFQIDVLRALLKVPFGHTVTYQDLAHQVNRPHAVRAIGQVMGYNPLPLFIPCHRVLSKGGLGGYSGGMKVKTYLLELEQSLPPSRVARFKK